VTSARVDEDAPVRTFLFTILSFASHFGPFIVRR
jgi:hypothetical protein